ncbi:2573_t:CDS:2 [Paraglomus brasilianum]|uniref:2573_t:CDS:1 n=1 Tax=Paraglomus brasilianum TaxID=144538 RepID=A0A9N9DR63_9GLOM|nr:2573_t:CDS:2 [Paraglomus brasilianum]
MPIPAEVSNSLEAEDDYYKMLLEDCAKDCVYFDSVPRSVKEEMPNDSDDDGYGGYNEYEKARFEVLITKLEAKKTDEKARLEALEARILKLEQDQAEREARILKLEQDQTEREAEKNRKFQTRCIQIAKEILNEEPIIEYRLNGLELDVFFQNYRIALGARGSASVPNYKGRSCCGKPELSVMLYGNINVLNEEDLETWLRETVKIPFVHVKKNMHVGYAHIHFLSHEDASDFFYTYKNATLDGPRGDEDIRIKESYYFGKSKRKVVYVKAEEPIVTTKEAEEELCKNNKTVNQEEPCKNNEAENQEEPCNNNEAVNQEESCNNNDKTEDEPDYTNNKKRKLA